MCWAEKCCYVIPANVGCVLLGICSFILSLFTLAAAVAFFIIESKESPVELMTPGYRLAKDLGLNLNQSSIHIILSIVIILTVLWMLFSVLLIIGVTKNLPSFVLSYFSFGIIITIICQLSALLVLLRNCWMLAMILFILSLLHIHFLVVVHTVYELMLRGKNFSLYRQQDVDQDLLAECFDENTESI